MSEQRNYYVVTFNEPDGRTTYALRETVEDVPRGYFLRHLVSFHPTFKDAMTAREVAYRKRGRVDAAGEASP